MEATRCDVTVKFTVTDTQDYSPDGVKVFLQERYPLFQQLLKQMPLYLDDVEFDHHENGLVFVYKTLDLRR